MIVGIIGLGFVGSAIQQSLTEKGIETIGYDKYKNGGIGTFDSVLSAPVIYLALPTPYNTDLMEYDKSAIYIVCEQLHNKRYDGIVIIKSTIEIGTMEYLTEKYPISYIHNPEFLTARTAYEDFHNQKHIVFGISSLVTNVQVDNVCTFHRCLYPDAKISICSYKESEAMKLFCNTFYAVKVQMFTEFHQLCHAMDISFENIKDLMLANKWIHPMHTTVPGPDGEISYGGYCFPKDTNALNELMKKLDSPNAILDACIAERDTMRDDHDNVHGSGVDTSKK
jgi:UDPglucose 6-dehydrogenase